MNFIFLVLLLLCRVSCFSRSHLLSIFLRTIFCCSQKYERGYQHYQNLISGLSDKETIDSLTSAINRDKAQEEMICLGMLTVILTEPHSSEKVHKSSTLFERYPR